MKQAPRLIEDKNFYPTPESLIMRMTEGYCFEHSFNKDVKQIKSILEPSAGKGDIVDYLLQLNSRERLDIDCVEANPTLQSVLKGKGYRVVHNDFLSYRTQKNYDLIIMNPPFDKGDKHLLKALEMQQNGGSISCLLNAETIKNPYTNSRKDLYEKLKELDAEIEFIADGFVDAERKTSVEVALIKVNIPAVEFVSDIFENMRKASKVDEIEITEEQKTALVSANFMEFLKSLITQYNTEIGAGIKLIKEYYAMVPHILTHFDIEDNFKRPILQLTTEHSNSSILINDFICDVRYKYWRYLFNSKQLTGKLTNKELKKYFSNIDKMRDYEFSIYNILTIKEEIQNNLGHSIEETILELFEKLSHKHYYDEASKNIHYYNGWKTNKCYKINNKVIIPFYSYNSKYDCYRTFEACEFIKDMTKVLDYLDCGRTDYHYDIHNTVKNALDAHNPKNIRLTFFDVSFYKKGTCHITFTNQDLLDKLNLFGSQRKGWLPPNYGKKPYSDMDAEEQAVVKEFSGSIENYNKIFNDQQYYLLDRRLLLEGNK